MDKQDLALLETLEARDAEVRRRAVWSSWGSVVLAAIILATLVGLSYRQRDRAQETVRALTARAKVERIRLSVLQQKKKRLEDQIADLQPLVENYRAVAARESTAALEERPSPPLPPPPEGGGGGGGGNVRIKRQPRVYLHIVHKEDRDAANEIGQRLADAGFEVMGVQNVPRAAGLKNNEVRYYRRAEREGAERLVKALESVGSKPAVPLYLGLENDPRLRPNQYEVWFAAGAVGNVDSAEDRDGNP